MLTIQNTVAELAQQGTEITAVATTPRLQFEEPRLEKRGDLTEVTAGGFGGFSP